jgi:putative tryptophan/tyrosine transport system substrate-binding protein
MYRRQFLTSALAGGLAVPHRGWAQHAVPPIIGMLDLGSGANVEQGWKAFRDGLREHGYVEGKTVAIESRFANGDAARLPALVAELVALNVKVIVTAGTTSIRAAKDVTRTVPIVIAVGADPIEMGFARSLAQPGGNITGLSILGSEIARKRLELLHAAVPRARVVAFLVQAANPGNPVFIKAMTTAASSLGFRLHVVKVNATDHLSRAFAEMVAANAEALVVIEDPTFVAIAKSIADLALSHHLPTMLGNRLYVYAGGLMAYGLVYNDLWRRAARYVDRILKGANPADMPIEQPNKFDLIINLTTARALNLTIPPALLLRADQVIE